VSDRRLRLAVGTLALIGAAVAAYLTYARYADASITCTSGGCETVQDSEYAVLAGIPVAVLGLGGYALIFATALSARETARLAGAVLAVAALAFSLFLLYLQLGPIGAVCDWCLANDAVAALLVPVATLRLR
jgi:uncharacterized membrane protein